MSFPSILTGQYVRIDQTPASVGQRLLAACLDSLFLAGLIVLSIYLTDYLPDNWKAPYIYALVLFELLYFPLFEIFNQGQSIGKHLLGLRVVKVDGSQPTLGSYLLRWLLYPVDVLFTGGVGLVCMLLTRHRQRLGDLAGGTTVVKERDYRRISVSLDEFAFLTPGYRPTYPQAADLSLEQIRIIERTLHSPASNRPQRIARLAQKAAQTLRLPAHAVPDEQLLQTLLRDYQFYALEDI